MPYRNVRIAYALSRSFVLCVRVCVFVRVTENVEPVFASFILDRFIFVPARPPSVRIFCAVTTRARVTSSSLHFRIKDVMVEKRFSGNGSSRPQRSVEVDELNLSLFFNIGKRKSQMLRALKYYIS